MRLSLRGNLWYRSDHENPCCPLALPPFASRVAIIDDVGYGLLGAIAGVKGPAELPSGRTGNLSRRRTNACGPCEIAVDGYSYGDRPAYLAPAG